ncbi:MAG: 50S ribosomal protein L9 [Fusobacteriaceae bacterium]|jgi:large subunit ribosomal protein L9|nr:50S ribosomal protein L9 [Fusobacteriaceae bacterium]
MAKIKVILLEDVAGQGRKGDVIQVSDGYAHNFLIKTKKGIIATSDELQKIENQKSKIDKISKIEKGKAEELKKLLESKKVHMMVKTGENGKLFGSITNKEVVQAIEEEFGVKIDKKKIVDCNVKSTGEHEISVKLYSEVKADVKLIVDGKE